MALTPEKLQSKCAEMRLSVLDAVMASGKGHIGGAYSMMELLVAVYYSDYLRFDASKPGWDKRDWFLLSKGHAGVGLYAVLSDCGFFPKSEMEKLNSGAMLGEHPDISIPGVETVGGSLGHALGVASGFALANKLDGNERRVSIIMGDGECYEGSVWEAAIFAAHQKLGNLFLIIDRNKLIATAETEAVGSLDSLEEKWKSFGWNVISADGHDLAEITDCLSSFDRNNDDKPTVLIAHTIKGKGVSFMENQVQWHHGALNEQNYQLAKAEIEQVLVG